MSQTIQEKNRALVLDAFDTLFNKRDYAAAEKPPRSHNDLHGQGDRMKDLLTRTLDAHGGLSRWREIEAFQLKVCIDGGLWRLKGLPDGLRDVTLRIQAHRPILTITPFGGQARPGTSRQTAYGSRMPMVASLRSVPRHGLRSPGAIRAN
jgi:hypothetical protein